MSLSLAHRGPDSNGLWTDPKLGIALAHQRLSIMDLSSAGHQPMHSSTGRYVIVFNGEIYNHLSLRSELAKSSLNTPWHGHSDTETILAAIEAWGLETTLLKANGMWAFALLDRQRNSLTLVRDHYGEKPLYWGTVSSSTSQEIVFASELSAIRSFPGFNNSINTAALSEYFRYGYVPSPLSIYNNIYKLPAGHVLCIPLPFSSSSPLPHSSPWWRLQDVIQDSSLTTFSSDEQALTALESALSESVYEQTISDVPLGAFLSGGIDSSLIAALLQNQISTPIRTFTIGFEDQSFNEAPFAEAVASHLGTDHTTHYLTSDDATSLIPLLPKIYSEPFADSSQLPTHLVCRAARQSGLTVALSGDGGDELFGGYNRYFWGPRIWNRLSPLPSFLRHLLGDAISAIPPESWDVICSSVAVNNVGQKAHKLAARLYNVTTRDELYQSLVCDMNFSPILLNPPNSKPINATAPDLPPSLVSDPVGRMMAWDSLGYLTDDILVKVDRAAMFVGLETRSPFLDHRVASVAWRMPTSSKIRSGVSKWPLRQILSKYVPTVLFERPKAGFAIPVGMWLRGPLNSWAEELLNPDRILSEGYLNPIYVQHIWDQHKSCRYDHTSRLWSILMWQSWLQESGL